MVKIIRNQKLLVDDSCTLDEKQGKKGGTEVGCQGVPEGEGHGLRGSNKGALIN